MRFSRKEEHLRSSKAGNAHVYKGTHKTLAEPFLSLVLLLRQSRENAVHLVLKDACGHLVFRSKVSLQCYWPVKVGQEVERKGKKTHCLTVRKPKHLSQG